MLTNEEIDNILNETIDEFEDISNKKEEKDCYYIILFNDKPCFFNKDFDKCYNQINKMIDALIDELDDTYNYDIKCNQEKNCFQIIKNLDFIIFNYSFPVYKFVIREIYNIDDLL